MSIIIAALLAAPLGAEIDRHSLDLQARAEAMQPRVQARARGASAIRIDDLGTIAVICSAAAQERDPGRFLTVLEGAYRLSASESAALRASCAGYLAARHGVRRASLSH